MNHMPQSLREVVTSAIGPEASGDQEWWTRFYIELKALARHRLRTSNPGATISTTVLVHEAYLKINSGAGVSLKDESHFMTLAAKVMRQVLVEYVRRKSSAKRIQGAVTFEDQLEDLQVDRMDIMGIHRALEVLETVDSRVVQIVECRFFGGFTNAEIAVSLELNIRTVERMWTRGKLLLLKMLRAQS